MFTSIHEIHKKENKKNYSPLCLCSKLILSATKIFSRNRLYYKPEGVQIRNKNRNYVTECTNFGMLSSKFSRICTRKI